MKRRGSQVVGVAIGAHRLVARIPPAGGKRSPFEWERTLPDVGPEWRGQVREALRSLHDAVAGAQSLCVTLMPPLASVRILELPIASPSDLRPAVTRDVAKYFPVEPGPHVVQMDAPAPAARGGVAPRVVSVASARVVEDILAAASESGWAIISLGAAPFAWVDAASNGAVAHQNESITVVAHCDGIDHSLTVQHGEIVRIRARRGADHGSSGVRVVAHTTDEAFDVAARAGPIPDSRSLWPDGVYEARDRAAWRRALWYGVASAAFLLAAAGFEWTSAGRAYALAAGARASIRPRVATVVATRDSVQALARRIVMLRSTDSRAVDWSALIGSVGAALPADASLISLAAAGDTIRIVGEAKQAAGVFAALAQTPSLTRVRADAPIQQQVENGELVAERFTIAALLSRRAR